MAGTASLIDAESLSACVFAFARAERLVVLWCIPSPRVWVFIFHLFRVLILLDGFCGDCRLFDRTCVSSVVLPDDFWFALRDLIDVSRSWFLCCGVLSTSGVFSLRPHLNDLSDVNCLTVSLLLSVVMASCCVWPVTSHDSLFLFTGRLALRGIWRCSSLSASRSSSCCWRCWCLWRALVAWAFCGRRLWWPDGLWTVYSCRLSLWLGILAC